jgi:hypothetical protein
MTVYKFSSGEGRVRRSESQRVSGLVDWQVAGLVLARWVHCVSRGGMGGCAAG